MADDNTGEFDQFFDKENIIKATFMVLKEAGEPITSQDLRTRTIKLMQVPDDALKIPQGGHNNKRPRFNYRQDWCKNGLKNYPSKDDGYILYDNVSKCWSINPNYSDILPDDIPINKLSIPSASEEEALYGSDFDWPPFFNELSHKLLSDYRNNREKLLVLIDEIYDEYQTKTGRCLQKMPTDDNGNLIDIDPFTIFALLNRGKNIRQDLVPIFREKFHLTANIPTNFKGVATGLYLPFYVWRNSSNPQWEDEYKADCERIWKLFELAVNYDESSDKEEFINLYDDILSKPGIRTSKLTIPLFFANNEYFLSLDKPNRRAIRKLNIFSNRLLSLIPEDMNIDVDGSCYLAVCEQARNELLSNEDINVDFVSLSSYADVFNKNNKNTKKEDSKVEAEINDIVEETIDADDFEDEKSPSNPEKGKNVIYYGIPGCGKSTKIENEIICGKNPKYYKRIIFHPDYTYADFVGQILPIIKEDKSVSYEFVPGPFTSILNDAHHDFEHQYFLIIEEINRGNAPAIFGDIFQLLDRDQTGRSAFEIENFDISYELFKNDSDESFEKKRNHKICIPKNLTIIATMNTADQNVFTLDTAFKRRWEMVYVHDEFINDNYSNKLKDAIIGESSGSGKSTGITWESFHRDINNAISNTKSITTTEDKRLGCYFCSLDEIKDINKFTNKVLRYLYDDVAKTNRHIFKEEINTFDKIIDSLLQHNDDLRGFFDDIFADGIITNNE